MPNATEAAARGEEFLDEYFQGWREIVNRDALDMARNDLCVGGQLSGNGDFWTFADRVRDLLGIPGIREFEQWAEQHGFFVICGGISPAENKLAYAPLNAAWQSILA